MKAFDKVAPGLYSKNTLLYGVEVKFYSSKVAVDNISKPPSMVCMPSATVPASPAA